MRWLLRGASVLVSVAVIDYLVLPQLAGTRKALHLLGNVNPGWAALAIALEAASLAGYSLMTRSVLPAERPRYGWLLRTDLVSLGVSHVLPGGAATASTLRFHLLRDGGTKSDDAAVGMAWQGVESTAVLVGLLWASLVVSIPLAGLHPLYVTVAVVGAVLLTAVVVGLSTRRGADGPAVVPAWLTARIPGRFRERAERALHEALSRLHVMLADHRGLRVSAGWSMSNWVLDSASLAVFLIAFGHRVDPAELFVAYGLANLVAVLPITPGGLGVIEGVLIPSLVGFGVPPAVAVLAVVSWRVLDFWAPIPVAGLCYLSLVVERWRGARAVAAA